MKKKLVLNKQIIANLNNPDRIFGGGDRHTSITIGSDGMECMTLQQSCGICPSDPGLQTCIDINDKYCIASAGCTLGDCPSDGHGNCISEP